MNPQVPDELISAYFDGEVTPEERAAVERLLAENEESQRELNETARLSALLHSFPRESAPSGFLADVLRQTDRLPMPAVSEPAASKVSRSSWGEWRAALISSVITSAALLAVAWGLGHFDARQNHSIATSSAPAGLSLSSPGRRSPEQPQEKSPMSFGPEQLAESKVALNDQVAPAKENQQAEGLPDGLPALAGVARKQAAQDAAPAAPLLKSEPPVIQKAQPYSTSRSAPKAIAQQPASAVAQMPAAAVAQNDQSREAESLQIDNYSNLLSNQAFLEKLQVGEMYTFVPQVADLDNTVGVVDLEVVDIDRGAETMQVLLRKNEIQPRAVKDAKDEALKKEKQSEDDLVVVYAVAPGERLVQALNDVNQHPDLFRSWSSQVPLQVAEDLPVSDDLLNRTQSDQSDADKPKKTVARRDGTADEKETVDAQRALATLVARNASSQLNTTANSAGSLSLGAVTAGGANNLSGIAGPTTKSANERTALKRGELLQRQNNLGKGDYEVLRVPVSGPVEQLNQMSRAMQQNGKELRRSGPGAAIQLKEKGAAGTEGNSNRAVRMLFVLHPANQAEASPMLPTPATGKASK